MFVATCFRIGLHYVITNRHVVDDIKKVVGVKNVWIDFRYKEEGGKRFTLAKKPVCFSSIELEYAIIKLSYNSIEELPPSIASYGFIIPSLNRCLDEGKFLTLIGHPGGSKKATDVSCPVKNHGDLDESVIVALGRREVATLRKNSRQTYDVSTFMHGSSGSPGLLLNEKLLMVLHCRGFFLEDDEDDGESVIEQGILMSAIVADVSREIKKRGWSLTLKKLFDIDHEQEPMDRLI
jgi:hypothetical protein